MSPPVKSPSLTVLIVDDEPQMRRLLTVTLEATGYRVISATNGQEGLLLAAQYRPDVILLDLGLPDLAGQTVLLRLREWCTTPIIILTVQDGEAEKITALDSGADDFVTKPFHSGELLARIRAALRHAQGPETEAVFRSGNIEVDLVSRVVRKKGQEVKLTPIEYSLLRFFVTHAGKVLTHRQLLTEVWGTRVTGDTHFLRVHIAHLRSKIEDNSERPELIMTEPGVGYRLFPR
jgi:two-component system KDP operon response regulator KdpE